MRQSRGRTYVTVFIALIALARLPQIILAQPNKTETSQAQEKPFEYAQSPTEKDKDLHSMLEARIDKLEGRIESEIKAADTRFQAMTQSTDRAFNILIWLSAIIGTIGTVLGIVMIAITWMRDRQRHQDYQHERRFYEDHVQRLEEQLSLNQKRAREDYERERRFDEERALRTESREKERHEHSIQLAESSGKFQTKLAEQQLAFGDAINIKSENMLGKQIDSITKLGGVIDLVQRVFDLLLTREEEQRELQKQLKDVTDTVSKGQKHFQDQYQQVVHDILTFKDHSRMAWTRLTTFEQSLAARTRATFQTIPNYIVDELSHDKPYEHGRVLQLLGVSAYYANDVIAAIEYLEKAKYLLDNDQVPSNYLLPRAFCLHFLGLIEKNWWHLDRPREANFVEAKQYLEKAAKLLKDQTNEFLTPLTLAEVLSYIDSERNNARVRTEENITRLNQKKTQGTGLNENQSNLLCRAYLIRGNLDFIDRKLADASKWYQKAIDHSKDYHFAWLSKALATEDKKERHTCFAKGLKLLEASNALYKQEDAVRLTACAWACIASGELKESEKLQKYQTELDAAEKTIRSVARREPLFFSPVHKMPESLKELTETVSAATK